MTDIDAIRAVVQEMREFAFTKPSRQQVRQKSAREMVELFVYKLEAAITGADGADEPIEPVFDVARKEWVIPPVDGLARRDPEREPFRQHARTCPAYGNFQPPYEQCDCGAREP